MSTTDVARRVRTHVRARPKLALAVKAALAAMLAWLLVRPLGSFATEYSYYAPLGALTVVSTSIAVSVRSSFEVVIGILLGAGIALAVQVVPLPEPLPLGLAVVVGSLVGASGVAGAMSGWVSLAAMFVMIAGRGDPVGYTAAYGGLTALGALVGVAVDLVLPQLPLTPAAIAQDRLRAELADQLDALAQALEQELLGEKDWHELRRTLERTARDAEVLVDQARDARRANWKAARWSELVDRHDRQERALQSLAGCVDEVIALVADQRAEIRRDDPVAADLRAATAAALQSVAGLLRGSHETDGARRAVTDLHDRVVDAQRSGGDHHFAAAAIALNLEQAVEAWS